MRVPAPWDLVKADGALETSGRLAARALLEECGTPERLPQSVVPSASPTRTERISQVDLSLVNFPRDGAVVGAKRSGHSRRSLLAGRLLALARPRPSDPPGAAAPHLLVGRPRRRRADQRPVLRPVDRAPATWDRPD